MKIIYILLAFMFLFGSNLNAQNFSYYHNPYERMNTDQLNLALEQAHKMKRSGMAWTAVGSAMMVGGGMWMADGISRMIYQDPGDFGAFLGGLGIMSFGAFPLTFGLVAWLTGNEKINMIEIELLAFDSGSLDFKPTEYGLGLALTF